MRKIAIVFRIAALATILILAGCGGTTATTTPAANQPSVTAAAASPKPVITAATSPSVASTVVSPPSSAKPTAPAGNSQLTDILGKITAITSVKYDSVISGAGIPSMTQKIFLKKSRMRIESSVQGMNTVMLIDTDKKTIYSYLPAQNTATKMDYSQAPTSVTDSKTIMDNNPVIIGSETIDGKDCLVIQYTSKDGTVKEWLWKDKGFPLKLEITSAKGTMTALNQNIDFSDIPDSTFDLPATAKIMDLGGLPTNLPSNFPTNFPTNLPTNLPTNYPAR